MSIVRTLRIPKPCADEARADRLGVLAFHGISAGPNRPDRDPLDDQRGQRAKSNWACVDFTVPTKFGPWTDARIVSTIGGLCHEVRAGKWDVSLK